MRLARECKGWGEASRAFLCVPSPPEWQGARRPGPRGASASWSQLVAEPAARRRESPEHHRDAQ